MGVPRMTPMFNYGSRQREDQQQIRRQQSRSTASQYLSGPQTPRLQTWRGRYDDDATSATSSIRSFSLAEGPRYFPRSGASSLSNAARPPQYKSRAQQQKPHDSDRYEYFQSRILNSIDTAGRLVKAIQNAKFDIAYPETGMQTPVHRPSKTMSYGRAATSRISSHDPRHGSGRSRTRTSSVAQDSFISSWLDTTATAVASPNTSFCASTIPILKSEDSFYQDPEFDPVGAAASRTPVNREKPKSRTISRPAVPPLTVLGSDWAKSGLHGMLDPMARRKLLCQQLATNLDHLENLRERISDKSSRVLVTGDLNAGKSTFINALLRREVMPVDQQPLTNTFCEVVDAGLNGGQEEVHGIVDDEEYDINDGRSYAPIPVDGLYDVLEDEDQPFNLLRIYTKDRQAPDDSILNNDKVPLRVVDSPGLNRDSVSTTSVFRREKQIDIVIFVVSAENHFTLSGTEFLKQSCKEKAWIFVVVNKWERIKNKERCRRSIFEQLHECLPHTAVEDELLVHFVSCEEVLKAGEDPVPVDFARLESSLKQFVLDKRLQSKLAPAKNYAINLVNDLETVTEWNMREKCTEIDAIKDQIAQSRPVHEMMLEGKSRTLNRMATIKKEAKTKVNANFEHCIRQVYFERAATIDSLLARRSVPIALSNRPRWGGFVNVRSYANHVRVFLNGLFREDYERCHGTGRDLVEEYMGKLSQAVQDDQLWNSQGVSLPQLPRMEDSSPPEGPSVEVSGSVEWRDLLVPYRDRLRHLMGIWLSGFSQSLGVAAAGDSITLESAQGQSLIMSVVRLGACVGLARYGTKWGALGVTVMVASAVALMMRDMQPHVDRMILSRFQERLLSQASTLNAPTFAPLEHLHLHLQTALSDTINNSELEQRRLEADLQETSEQIQWFQDYVEQLNEFKEDVESIDLDA